MDGSASPWTTKPIIYEDEGENEAELKASFILLCAKHKKRSPFEIGEYVFRNLRDGAVRGAQAGMIWFGDLEVREAIDEARQGGKFDKHIESDAKKQVYENEILAIARNSEMAAKDRLAAYELAAKMNNFIMKPVESEEESSSGGGKGGRRFSFVIGSYDEMSEEQIAKCVNVDK